MARKAKTEPNPATLVVNERWITDAEKRKLMAADTTEAEAAAIYSGLTARAISEPEVKAASVIQDFQGDSLDINPLVDELRQQVADVQSGTLKRPEAMLVAQAHTLDALFSSLARRSNGNYQAGHLDAAEKYLKLAFRAQAQAVRTIEALAELKNPRPVAFVRQANFAENQQVINGEPAQAGQFEKQQSKLSAGGGHELLPNTRTPSLESATHPAMATVATLDRPEVARGQGEG